MIAIGIFGARGRMGDALLAEISAVPNATLAGGVEHAGHIDIGQPLKAGSNLVLGDDPAVLATAAGVLIDFSAPAALQRHLDICVAARRPLVIGTTGFEVHHEKAIDAAARQIPVLQSFNMSIGVNVLAGLVAQAAQLLGADWDIEIVEMHHSAKVDAPSGTALLLGRAAAAARGVSLADHADRGRNGITGARVPGHIGFASLRGGTVAGDHQVTFAGASERIELVHRAENRSIFARGAVRAALWLAGQQPGRYAIADMFKL
jgi:4-hydroxy-tetrahydrodipicolinate reductase